MLGFIIIQLETIINTKFEDKAENPRTKQDTGQKKKNTDFSHAEKAR